MYIIKGVIKILDFFKKVIFFGYSVGNKFVFGELEFC